MVRRKGPAPPDPDAIRQTRRFEWIDHALAPLRDRLAPDQFRRLRYALTLVFGAEALIVLRDVCRLDPGEATEIMRWAAAALIRSQEPADLRAPAPR